MTRALLLSTSAALLLSCGTLSPSTPAPSCDFAVTLDTLSCRFYKNPDQFASDSWFLDFTGKASGPIIAHAETQLVISNPSDINITVTCPSWSQGGNMSCLSQANQPASTTFSGSVEILVSGRTTITTTVTAKVDEVGQVQCSGNKTTQQTITCS